MSRRRPSAWEIALWLATAAQIAAFAWLKHRKLAMLDPANFDTGVLAHSLYWLPRGVPVPVWNAERVSMVVFLLPIYLLYIPFAQVLPGAMPLEFMTALSAGAASIPLFYWMRRLAGAESVAFAFGVSILLSPHLNVGVMSGYQPSLIAAAATLAVFGAVDAGRPRAKWAALALANATRPQAVFTLLMTALLHRAGAWREAWRRVALVQALWLGVAASAFVGAQFLIEDGILHQVYAAKVFHLEGLGTTTGGAFETLLSRPAALLQRAARPENAAWLATLLLPTLGLALLTPRLLLAGLPFLGFTLVSTPRQSGAEALIALFYAAAGYGAAGLIRRRPALAAPLAAGVLAVSLAVHWALTPADLGPIPLTRHWRADYYRVTDHDRRSLEILRTIPPEASVMAHHLFIPYLVDRPRVGQFPSDALRPHDYGWAIVDFTKPPRRRDHRREFFEATLRVLREEDYGVERFEDGVLVLRRGADRGRNAEALREAARLMAAVPTAD